MSRRLLWCAGAILVGLVVHREARACSCGAAVGPAVLADPQPANALFQAVHCVADIPSDHLRVYVDGVEASVVDTGLALGDYEALLRVEPVPMEGQTIEFDGCGAGDCVSEFGPTQWIAGAPDLTPPVASVGAISLSTEEKIDDGLACPPFGQVQVATLEDFSFDDDVVMVRAEAVDGETLVGAGVTRWTPGQDDVAVRVYTDQNVSCMRVYALDVAGNETFLGPEDCTFDPASADGTGGTTAEADGDDEGGCVCSSTGAPAPGSMVLLVLGLGAIGRRRR